MQLVNSEEKIKKPLVWFEIDKANLLKNVNQVKKLAKSSQIMAVLKANAYGLGILGVAKIVEPEVDTFGVVGIKEGLVLRNGGVTKPIINLGIYSFEDAEELISSKIRPTIFTLSALKDFENKAKETKSIGRVWIKVDTGLNRLGVPWEKAVELIRSASEFENIKIEGVFSSLTEDVEFDRVQLERFIAIKKECQDSKIQVPIWSIASSESVFLFPQANLDMIRTGISLLGFYSSPGAKTQSSIKLLPVASFKTRVACLKEIGKGESIFYRKKFVADQKTRIATLLSGYSYGLDSQLVKGGKVLIGGQKYPLVGGITMTNCFVDIGDNYSIKAGDEVVVFGRQENKEIFLEEVCTTVGQSEYEFLSRIPDKVERLYL